MALQPNVVLEKTTPTYSFQLAEGATDLTLAQTSALTLTLYETYTGSDNVINSRSAQSILNTNNGTVSSAGVVAWVMQQGDTTLYTTTLTVEPRIALFEFTYDTGTGGTKYGKHEYAFKVQNLKKVS